MLFTTSRSQDGEIVYVDWMPQKDQDTGKIQSKIFSMIVRGLYNFIDIGLLFISMIKR